MSPRTETLTTEQIARRRKIERTSQRNSRAKTKARIQELERVLESFQSTEGDDDRAENTVKLLMKQQEHGRRLQDILRDVHKLLSESRQLWHGSEPKTPTEKDDNMSLEAKGPPTREDLSPRPTSDLDALPSSNLGQCVLDSSVGIAANPKSIPVWRSVDIALERAVDHLSKQELPLSERDVDIAIRAVADGWSNVKTMHALDIGWLTLKELDQTLFCDCSPPTRLVILRAMRLNMLKHASNNDAGLTIPPFYCYTPAQQMVKHPLLVDFFPWPNLRDFLILMPSIYQSEVFPSHFSRNVHFLWPLPTSDAWTVDCSSAYYSFCPVFESRLMDITYWALSSDFFAHYPQLVGYVPMHDPSPCSISPRDCEEIDQFSTDLVQAHCTAEVLSDPYDFSQEDASISCNAIAMVV